MRGEPTSGLDDTIRPVYGPGPGAAGPVAAPAAAPVAGQGFVELARVGGRTEVVRLRSESPLRLLSPRNRSRAAWLVAGSYGGGLVTGDRLDVTVCCGDGTAAVLGTQASTKVYRAGKPRRASSSWHGHVLMPVSSSALARIAPSACTEDQAADCRQSLRASLGDDAVLVSWPDPITCFAGSRYRQRQAFELSPTASLVAVDWLTSGRMARGERWAFERFASVTTVRVAGELKLRESLTLDPNDGPLDTVARTGGFDCLGTAWIVGPAFEPVVRGLCERLERVPIDPRRDVLFGLSRLGDADRDASVAGAVLRFAARSTDAAWRWLRSELSGVLGVVGVDPWSRRG